MNARKSKKSVKKKSKIKFIISFILFQIVFTGITAPFLAYYGPFENVRNTLVTTAMTTLSHQWIAELFLSKETINKILKEQAVTNLSQKKDAETEVIVSNKNDKTIERFEVNSNKFTGYVLIINDSTRVKVGYSEKLEIEGQTTSEIAENNGAIAAINGGGFTDEATGSLWTGTGAKPTGIIMSNGEVKYNDLSSDDEQREVVAITEAGVLLVGSYSLNELIQHKAKEAVSFGPALIVDGQKAITNGDGGWGIAPRTAIGQRKDGAIILLVIDGRQTNSIGATLKEAQDVLYEYGAYNASNLDGGSSSTMYYKGEVINSPSDSLGERAVPSAIYVEK
ncbi:MULTISPECIES: phosphodiester glycosidase family protein [unclassified Clostridium]|uniref:phosphodiester glycosidase family protein n=1 Tax=unclassified Clostridium TaxID=2614128 RepID=UPI0025BE1E96|nr:MULTISPECIES: phosphodiester glycosidase family protein [unclassified Clostridium]